MGSEVDFEEFSMRNEVENKFTWVLKNFSSLQCDKIYSDPFFIGGCKWCLLAYPKGSKTPGNLSLFLVVADSKTLSSGWRRQTKFSFTVVNQLSDKLSQVKGEQLWWFDQKAASIGFPAFLPLTELHARNGGFLVSDELKIVAQVEVCEVIGKLDVPNEPEAVTQPQKKIKREDTSSVMESVDVNGFLVRPSQLQVEFMSRVFKKYPEIAIQIREKNEPLRTSCLYVFLGIIETLCKSIDELSDDNLVETENSLNYLKCSSIKVDWLEKKVEEVKEKKKQEQIGVARSREFEATLKIFEQKCSDVKALLEKEKANVLAARAPTLTLDEVV